MARPTTLMKGSRWPPSHRSPIYASQGAGSSDARNFDHAGVGHRPRARCRTQKTTNVFAARPASSSARRESSRALASVCATQSPESASLRAAAECFDGHDRRVGRVERHIEKERAGFAPRLLLRSSRNRSFRCVSLGNDGVKIPILAHGAGPASGNSDFGCGDPFRGLKPAARSASPGRRSFSSQVYGGIFGTSLPK